MHKNLDPFAPQSKVNKLYIWIGVALLVVAVVIGLIGSGVFGLGRAVGSPVTNAGSTRPQNVTSASDLPGAPITQATGNSAPVTMDTNVHKKMPQDILDWLKHLEKTEKKRGDLTAAAMSELMVQQSLLQNVGGTEDVVKALFGDDADAEIPDPAKELETQGRDHNKGWQDLIAFFDSVPPPTSCVPIRNAYAQCLGETSTMYTEILDVMASASNDPKGVVAQLMKMKGKSSGRIDVAAKDTDRLVQKICDEYDTTKWFGISSN